MKILFVLELESNLTSITLLVVVISHGDQSLPLIPAVVNVIAAVALPAAALRLAILDALRLAIPAAVPHPGLRRALWLGMRSPLVQLNLVVVAVEGVVVHHLVVSHSRCRGVEFLRHGRRRAVVRRRMASRVGAIQLGRRRRVIRRYPDAT